MSTMFTPWPLHGYACGCGCYEWVEKCRDRQQGGLEGRRVRRVIGSKVALVICAPRERGLGV